MCGVWVGLGLRLHTLVVQQCHKLQYDCFRAFICEIVLFWFSC